MVTIEQRERENFRTLLAMARQEDFGPGDATGALLPPEARARARFVAREDLVLCGGVFLEEIARAYGPAICTEVQVADGQFVPARTVLASWDGPAVAMFSAERVALNFLQRLSGIATLTARHVAQVAGTRAEIYDTRKTTPGWREIEKYAVRAGGGRNHRRGLYDAMMFKDNHVALASRCTGTPGPQALRDLIARARGGSLPLAFVMVEVDTLEQFSAALELPVDIILLDNMSPAQMSGAVAMRDAAGLAGRVELEASGGITLASLAEVASTGVERISIGALTHSATACDIGLDIEPDA